MSRIRRVDVQFKIDSNLRDAVYDYKRRNECLISRAYCEVIQHGLAAIRRKELGAEDVALCKECKASLLISSESTLCKECNDKVQDHLEDVEIDRD